MQPEDLAAVNQSGSSAYINLITTISVLALVLPNFSQDSLEANYSLPINWLLTFVSISLYGIFLRGQVGRYRNLFIETAQQPKISVGLSLAADASGTNTSRTNTRARSCRAERPDGGRPAGAGADRGIDGEPDRNRHQRPRPAQLPRGLLVGLLVVAPEALNASRPLGKGSCSGRSTLSTGRPSRPSASRCRRFWRSANSRAPM